MSDLYRGKRIFKPSSLSTILIHNEYFDELEKLIDTEYPGLNKTKVVIRVLAFHKDMQEVLRQIKDVDQQDVQLYLNYVDGELNGILECSLISPFQLKEEVSKLIDLSIKQKSCQHEYERPMSFANTVFKDGRGVCIHCDFHNKDAFEQDEASQVIYNVMAEHKEYPTMYDWRDKRGNIIDIDYTTYGLTGEPCATFALRLYDEKITLRSDDVKSAEEQAWRLYQSHLNSVND